ncbi:MAG: hypothetical protein K2J15_04770 [Muribaculaceae bacterium]|nr:hypothetical protein [Muribaculaceae bacterium]
MKHNNSQNVNRTLRLAGVIFLMLLWVALVLVLFVRGGINLKNILVATFSGFIIIYPLWKKYIRRY